MSEKSTIKINAARVPLGTQAAQYTNQLLLRSITQSTYDKPQTNSTQENTD
jgi:hypothetical protein